MSTPTVHGPPTVADSVLGCVGSTPLVRLSRLYSAAPFEVLAKLEMLNPGGSSKDRAARFIVEEGLSEGWIRPDTHLVESSSGNLGIALAMAARAHDLAFTCVVDPKIASVNLRILGCMGVTVDMVTEVGDHLGFLQARLSRVHELIEQHEHALWINQYANPLNWRAHYEGIGAELDAQAGGRIDVAVIACGTTGTIMGVARRLREHWPDVQMVAVDAVGSTIFSGPTGRRDLPGIGSTRVPEILEAEEVDTVVHVTDHAAALGCRALLAKEGIFAGGSSGSVVAAIDKLAATVPAGARVVTVFPDRGERYLDLVYNDEWVAQHRPPDVLRDASSPVVAPIC